MWCTEQWALWFHKWWGVVKSWSQRAGSQQQWGLLRQDHYSDHCCLGRKCSSRDSGHLSQLGLALVKTMVIVVKSANIHSGEALLGSTALLFQVEWNHSEGSLSLSVKLLWTGDGVIQVKCFLCFIMWPSLVFSFVVFLLLLCYNTELSQSYFHNFAVVYFCGGDKHWDLLGLHLADITLIKFFYWNIFIKPRIGDRWKKRERKRLWLVQDLLFLWQGNRDKLFWSL